jgi:diguanylate cyclase (GGDEF)-like protein
VDYDRHWRRAILGASAARCFGALQDASAVEDIFLAALLQDIAILGVDRAAPDFYSDLPRDASHRELQLYETERLGIDHAALGAWLLAYWKLPESLCRAVGWSHSPPTADRATPTGMGACCVALGSECVDALLTHPGATDFAALAEHASEWLGLDAPAVAEVISRVVAEVPDIERLFDRKLLRPDAASVILDQARDLMVLRDLQTLEQASNGHAASLKPDVHNAAPPDERQRDALTGLYNRGYLDLMLRREFQAAMSGHWPLSVVFVDLDRLKGINDAYGHEAADAVLVATARSIEAVARDTDCVARYGGTEFVVALPGLASSGAKIFYERLLARLRSTVHTVGGEVVIVSASVGFATHAPKKPFQRASQLITAAERSARLARKSRRDQPARHKSGAPVPAASA